MLSVFQRWRRSQSKGIANPRVPSGMTVYAIGDVHGERARLDLLLSQIMQRAEYEHQETGQQAEIIFLGDYVDRGPDSRGVLDRLCHLQRQAKGHPWLSVHFLRGNHEMALLEFLQTSPALPPADWLRFGGVETLVSYGVAAIGSFERGDRRQQWRNDFDLALPADHLAFLRSLRPYREVGDYFFVHAGVAPKVPLDQQSEQDLLWIREPFLSSSHWHGRRIVHGHTIVEEPEFLDNRIAIDTGAYDTGCLTALVLSEYDVSLIQTERRLGIDNV